MSVEAARAAEVLAQLSVPDRLLALAELVRRGKEGASLAELSYAMDMPLPKVGDACARLVGLGLAIGSGNGFYRARPEGLRDAADAVDRLQPITALLKGYPQLRGNFSHGRLTSLPPTLSDRYELIGELLARYLALDGLYAEDEINRRLATVTDEVAGARRMLVDTGWLERDRAGTTYGPGRPLPEPARTAGQESAR
jgi:DNA-binding IclR family transcriptional regulator